MASVLPKPVWHPEAGGAYRFSLEQFYELSDKGYFDDLRVELLNGGLFVMPRQGPPHAELVRKLNERMVGLYAGRYRISPQCPVVLLAPPPDYVEPDVALLKPEDYSQRDVTSDDVELIVEISDSTLDRDQGEKLAAYARNRIPEVWVLDVNANLLHIYQDSNGKLYRQSRVLEKGNEAEFAGARLEWW